MSRITTPWRRSLLVKLVVMASVVLLLQACGGGGKKAPAPVPVSHWVWVSGSNTVDQAGTYGTKGTAALANVPEARSDAVSWTDSSNILWMFGGYGFSSAGSVNRLSDLWKFDPVSGFWTWVSGSNTVNQAGNYGTKGTAALANVPGARSGAVSWTDSSNALWMFGGYGFDSVGTFGFLNDLWKFDPVSGFWTWVTGSNTVNQAGTYGTQGTAALANVPGARSSAVSWTDSGNTLWMFGGYGSDTTGTSGFLNDLWKFNPTSGLWTWVSGSDTRDQPGNYGTQGVAAPSNVPGARESAVSWIDSNNTLKLFGGSAGKGNDRNDLWQFNPASGLWTWISGSNAINQISSHGTQGVAAPSNVPGARNSAIYWTDNNHTQRLFGGVGYDNAGTSGSLNDLWRYVP